MLGPSSGMLVIVTLDLLSLHVHPVIAKSRGSHSPSRRHRRTQGFDFDEIDYELGDWTSFFPEQQYRHEEIPQPSRKCGKGGKGDDDSCAPTMSPMPSNSPSVSMAPSTTPSVTPTQTPSVRPSKRPTGSPSVTPSASPTMTIQPSSVPSTNPTLSSAETMGENGLVTACRVDPPQGDGVTRQEALVFRYNLYIVTDADPAEQVAIMEQSLHRGLSGDVLSCDYDSGNAFYVTSLAVDPPDSVSTDACNVTADPTPAQASTCHVVLAETTCTVFVPDYSSRRFLEGTSTTTTVVSPELWAATGGYLESSMGGGEFVSDQIVQVSFQGFVNTSNQEGGDVDGLARGDSQLSNGPRSPIAVGTAAVGLAVLVLLFVVTLTTRRRQQRPKAYVKHLEELSMGDGIRNRRVANEVLGDKRPVMWRKDAGDDDDYDYDDLNSPSSVGSPSAILDMSGEISVRHDPRACTSPTCPVCRNKTAMQPTFIHSSHLGYSIKEMRRLRDVSRIRESYRSPDTVEL